jgi:dUTPase
MPVYAYKDSAFGDMCADLFANEDVEFYPGEVKLVKTGVHCVFPEGWGAKLHDRSGNSKEFHVRAGVIDAGYTGEIAVRIERNANWWDMIKLWAIEHIERLGLPTFAQRESTQFIIKRGDKLAQMEVKPFFQAHFVEMPLATELPVGRSRGERGFGSTGK